MGKVIVEQIVTADGFGAEPDGGIRFMEVFPDSVGMEQEQLEMLTRVDAIVFGATTYRMFADYWPTRDPAEEAVASPINRLPKHVVSNTLDSAPWGDLDPVTIERGDGAEVVARLRDHYDGDLIIWGSFTLTDALFRAGLVDVLRLRKEPLLIGAGRTVTPSDLPMTKLRLEASRAFALGHVNLTYSVVR